MTRHRQCSRAHGLTLIELMLVVGLAALLLTLAAATWQAQILRTHRSEARIALLEIAAAQERRFLQHHRYAQQLSAPPPAGLGLPDRSRSERFELRLTTDADRLGWRAEAVALAGTAQYRDGDCRVLALDHLGRRSALRADGSTDRELAARCWR